MTYATKEIEFMDVWKEGQTLRRFVWEEAARHKGPENALNDAIYAALPTALRNEANNAHTPGPIGAWLHARGTWLDDVLRRSVSPGHGHVVVLGGGLNRSLLQLPQGLLGDGVVHILDTPELIEAQRKRTENLSWETHVQQAYTAVDPQDLSAVLEACNEIFAQSPKHLPVTCLLYSPATLWKDGPQVFVETLLERINRPIHLAWDWFDPAFNTLPAQAQGALKGAFGAPSVWHNIGVDMWLRALGIQHVETTPLLSWREQPVGFGTWVAWESSDEI